MKYKKLLCELMCLQLYEDKPNPTHFIFVSILFNQLDKKLKKKNYDMRKMTLKEILKYLSLKELKQAYSKSLKELKTYYTHEIRAFAEKNSYS